MATVISRIARMIILEKEAAKMAARKAEARTAVKATEKVKVKAIEKAKRVKVKAKMATMSSPKMLEAPPARNTSSVNLSRIPH